MGYLNRINSPDDLKNLSPKELKCLCTELRRYLVKTLANTGGHLASNLGVVELTVALHYCFNTPDDKIIWDVGHQSYIHKILTGRRKELGTIRQSNGLSGFPRPDESVHDAFGTGHSSTSISAGLGMCHARELKGENHSVISVIGDGSLTGGLAYEGLNNAGRFKGNYIVILNDNQMSISENVGALARSLNVLRTARPYLNVKEDTADLLQKIPFVGKGLSDAIEKTKNSIKYLFVPGALFEELGFKYIGPINGHCLVDLIGILNKLKHMNRPVLLHVYTTKGKGYTQAEKSPADFHGIDSFNIKTGKPTAAPKQNTYSNTFGTALTEIAKTESRTVAITAAMVQGTGLEIFEKTFPHRIFDVGIAESHGVTFAAGLARAGLIPVVAVYSTFLQRAYDQILHDVCLQNLPVIFAIDRAGVVGRDGETHQGMFDIAFLSHIPNITVMAPKNAAELTAMLQYAVKLNSPVAIRFPRAAASKLFEDMETPIEQGKSETIYQGSKIAVISLGAMADTAHDVYQRLVKDGHIPTLINARFVKPIDKQMISDLQDYDRVFVLEDAAKTGGFGSLVAEEMRIQNIDTGKLHIFAFPDEFIKHGTRDEIFIQYGMDAEGIHAKIQEIL